PSDDSYFFFQAEDGIRDKLVTGVQTCALPIAHASSNSDLTARAGPRASRDLPRHDVSVRSESRPQLEVHEDADRRAAAVEQLQLRRHQVQRPKHAYGAAHTAAPELPRITRRH